MPRRGCDVSRRTGPGGRLRPSPRTHRPGTRDLRDTRHLPHPRPEGAPRSTSLPEFGPGDRPLPAFDALDPLDDLALEGDAVAIVAEPVEEHTATASPPPVRTREIDPVPLDVAGARPPERRRTGGPPIEARTAPSQRNDSEDSGGERTSCTAPQLRRFIKSRAYVPMHELRRRFAIDGEDDDVTPLDVDTHRIFVGLPAAEGRLLGDLVRNGEVGYELSMDPTTPIVVGVYSMRPVSRS